MRTTVVITLFLLLAGCATERYYPVHLADGSGYYIAERQRAAGDYASLYALGMHPWWVHTFYSPYFYPHYYHYYNPFYDPYFGPYFFAGWYPAWPHQRGYQGHYSFGWPPYHADRYQAPGQIPGRPQPTQPGYGTPGSPGDLPVADRARARASGDRIREREAKYQGASPPQRVTAPVRAEQRPRATAPVGRSAAAPGASPPGAPADSKRAAPYSAGIPAASASQPVSPATSARPLSVEPARIRRAPSERTASDRDQ